MPSITNTINKSITNSPYSSSQPPDDYKDQNLKYDLSKFEYDLYHEEDDVAEKVIAVKRISLPNDGEKWKIFENNKAMFTIEGAKLNKKERAFLRTGDGVNYIIFMYKEGIKSFNYFKTELKKKLTK